MPITAGVWITREMVTVKHLRGILEQLESNDDVLEYTQIRIMALPNNLSAGVEIPGQTSPDGKPLILTDENLPAQGILLLGDDD
ncbi:hypothetical protein IU501_01145 [Nocardia otitidiscaviarum]|uniref:hypothetical protein n=1 Tax=Nocardia otitidiscaviarum TaxID=1823 RepID=UPI0018959612|nr:hypothetical protein [Nocardia otitidiscaviarum]MBF6131611.1 hypothetical protein [Nocardia otitidiscaviarum]